MPMKDNIKLAGVDRDSYVDYSEESLSRAVRVTVGAGETKKPNEAKARKKKQDHLTSKKRICMVNFQR